jgi:hypothetical protein
MGYEVGEAIPLPEDKYTGVRHGIDNVGKNVKITKKQPDALRQFLDKDRMVMRFFCFWDDRANPFGELRKFVSRFSHEFFEVLT